MRLFSSRLKSRPEYSLVNEEDNGFEEKGKARQSNIPWRYLLVLVVCALLSGIGGFIVGRSSNSSLPTVPDWLGERDQVINVHLWLIWLRCSPGRTYKSYVSLPERFCQ